MCHYAETTLADTAKEQESDHPTTQLTLHYQPTAKPRTRPCHCLLSVASFLQTVHFIRRVAFKPTDLRSQSLRVERPGRKDPFPNFTYTIFRTHPQIRQFTHKLQDNVNYGHQAMKQHSDIVFFIL